LRAQGTYPEWSVRRMMSLKCSGPRQPHPRYLRLRGRARIFCFLEPTLGARRMTGIIGGILSAGYSCVTWSLTEEPVMDVIEGAAEQVPGYPGPAQQTACQCPRGNPRELWAGRPAGRLRT
jgi:hypothetical protein